MHQTHQYSPQGSLRHSYSSIENQPAEKVFTNVENDENKSIRRKNAVKNIIMGCIFTVLLASVTMLYSSPHPKLMSEMSEEIESLEKVKVHKLAKTAHLKRGKKALESDSDSLSFTLNRYGYDPLPYFDPDYDSHLIYAFLQSYDAVIEPYATMELYLYDEDDELTSSSKSYEYVVCPDDTSTGESCQIGTMKYTSGAVVQSGVTVSCSPHTSYTISVFTLDESTSIISQSTASAYCMYVRREIRDLTEADLNDFLDAHYTITTLDQTEGEAMYGENFMSQRSLSKLHYYNAAQRDADHFHEGNGFLVQHVKITNDMELSIQSVNPAVSLPYWDFTIDRSEGKYAFDSFLSSSDVYGTVTKPEGVHSAFTRPDYSVEDARIPDSRWADLSAEYMNDDFPDMVSGYGYFRAPWSLNPSPYLSRYAFDWDNTIMTYLPSCSDHYLVLTFMDSLMNYFFEISFSAHASAHTTYGGIFGCEQLDTWTTRGIFTNTSMQHKACSAMGSTIKQLYRAGYIEVETDCTVNDDSPTDSTCNYVCQDEGLIAAAANLFYSQISSYMSPDTSYTMIERMIIEFMCESGMNKMYVGEHYESASMSDPTFWVMHPTLERLTHAKLLSGGFMNETWSTDSINDFVCLMPACYDETTGLTDIYESCCYGHFEDDRMYDGLTGSRSSYYGVTNGEMMTVSDPRSEDESDYAVSYIYDNFDWDHCDSDDDDSTSDINSLLDELYVQYEIVIGEIEVDDDSNEDIISAASKIAKERRQSKPTKNNKKTDKKNEMKQSAKQSPKKTFKTSSVSESKRKSPAKKLSEMDTNGRTYTKPDIEIVLEAKKTIAVHLALQRMEMSQQAIANKLKLAHPYAYAKKIVSQKQHTGNRKSTHFTSSHATHSTTSSKAASRPVNPPATSTVKQGGGPVKPPTTESTVKQGGGPVKPPTTESTVKQGGGPVKPPTSESTVKQGGGPVKPPTTESTVKQGGGPVKPPTSESTVKQGGGPIHA